MSWHFEKPYHAPVAGLDGRKLDVDDYMRIRRMILDHSGPNRDLPVLIQSELELLHKKKYPDQSGTPPVPPQ